MGHWREQLATWRLPVPDFPLVPEESALVVVDMQYMDAHPDYGLGKVFATVDPSRAQYYFSRLRDTVIPNLQRLLEVFRAAGLRVIYLTLGPVLADGSDLSPNFRRRYRLEERSLGFQVTHPVGTPEHRVLDEIAPRPGELVINKTANSAFNASNIDRVLRNLEVRTLVIAGVGTEVCVETTARDAVDRGFNGVIVEDACATLDDASHNSALLTFARWFGKVASTDDVIAELRRGRPAGPDRVGRTHPSEREP
ncbi:MAG TPA: isochorismatase family cysteine hydrolase [bacterium]|nr:isochorismatase family cysteine hydrolase [bacterium]